MSTPAVPPAATLLDQASNVIGLQNETYRFAVAAGAIAAANNGTPLPPNSTTQQLLNYVGGGLQSQIPSNLLSIYIQQLMTLLYRNSVITGSVALSGTIPTGQIGSQTVTISGAEAGDFVSVSFSAALGASPYQTTAQVTAANTVVIGIWNPAGFFDLSLTGKTMYVRVTKRTA